MWINPIFDRTQEDIDNKTPKAYLNVEDFNRIENNIQYISETMGVHVNTKNWDYSMIPSESDFLRIKNNIEILESKIKFTTYWDFPENPINTYSKLNTIESLIMAIKGDWDLVDGTILHTGNFGYANNELI